MTYRLPFSCVPGLLALGLLSLPAFATGTQAAAPRAAAAPAASSPLHQQLSRDKSRVARLQQGVAEQESRSRQAAARLQQQDSTIAELKKQLQAVQSGQRPSPAGQ